MLRGSAEQCRTSSCSASTVNTELRYSRPFRFTLGFVSKNLGVGEEVEKLNEEEEEEDGGSGV